MSRKATRSRNRLEEVRLDEATIPRGVADRDHERAVAIFDLVEDNSFGVHRPRRGPLQPDDRAVGIAADVRGALEAPANASPNSRSR